MLIALVPAFHELKRDLPKTKESWNITHDLGTVRCWRSKKNTTFDKP